MNTSMTKTEIEKKYPPVRIGDDERCAAFRDVTGPEPTKQVFAFLRRVQAERRRGGCVSGDKPERWATKNISLFSAPPDHTAVETLWFAPRRIAALRIRLFRICCRHVFEHRKWNESVSLVLLFFGFAEPCSRAAGADIERIIPFERPSDFPFHCDHVGAV